MVPVISYNYGAGNRKRIPFIPLFFLPQQIMLPGSSWCRRFLRAQLPCLLNPAMQRLTLEYLYCASFRFPFPRGCQQRFSFISAGSPLYSTAVSLIRQCIVVLPVACIVPNWHFPWSGGSFSRAEAAGFALFLFYRQTYFTKTTAIE